MTWTLKNSSNDPGEMTWFVSPTSGTIEAFGEIVVEVVAQTIGLNARVTPYVASFDIHSDDVCVCRDQSVEVAIELVVTAEMSAANSYIEVIDPANVEASGELVFRIIPVRIVKLPKRFAVALRFPFTERLCAPMRRLTTRACLFGIQQVRCSSHRFSRTTSSFAMMMTKLGGWARATVTARSWLLCVR
jgi:hypothetical protein